MLILADILTISFAALGVLAILGGVLLRRGSGSTSLARDDTPTTVATRGTRIPMIIGRRRVGAVFAWAGDRFTDVKRQESGKGFGGGVSTEETTYFESGMHVLALGPCNTLHAIYDSTGQIWSGPISSDTSPSGTSIETGNSGTFRIYWGEYDQPKDSFIVGATDVNTNHPGVCYVVWNRHRNGSTPRWEQLEYDLGFACIGNALGNSEYTLDDGSSVGVNPAHAIYQLLTAPYPHGAGMDPDCIDSTSLEAMGVLMESEYIPINMLIGGEDDAATVEGAVQAILADTGHTMSHIDGRLAFLPVREASGAVPSFGSDIMQVQPRIQIASPEPRRLIYEFDDENRGYRTSDVVISTDGINSQSEAVNDNRIDLVTVTHPDIAQKVANRRSQEDLGDRQSLEFTVKRAASPISVGEQFDVAGVGRVRLTEMTYQPNGHALMAGLLESYSVPEADSAFGGEPSFIEDAAIPDLAFTFLEVPASVREGPTPRIVVFRVRANQNIAGAQIYTNADGGSFSQAGSQNTPSIGGLLESGFDAVPGTLVTGPTFEPQNDDITNILNLSNDTAEWENGRQLLVVDSEVMYLQSVTVQSETAWAASMAYSVGDYVVPSTANGLRYRAIAAGTSDSTEPTFPTTVGQTVVDNGVTWEAHRFSYQLNNVIRGQLGTTVTTHNTGSQVFIADAQTLEQIGSPAITDGVVICVKSVPFTFNRIVALADVTEFCRIIGTTERITSTGDRRVTSTADVRIAAS